MGDELQTIRDKIKGEYDNSDTLNKKLNNLFSDLNIMVDRYNKQPHELVSMVSYILKLVEYTTYDIKNLSDAEKSCVLKYKDGVEKLLFDENIFKQIQILKKYSNELLQACSTNYDNPSDDMNIKIVDIANQIYNFIQLPTSYYYADGCKSIKLILTILYVYYKNTKKDDIYDILVKIYNYYDADIHAYHTSLNYKITGSTPILTKIFGVQDGNITELLVDLLNSKN